MDILIVTAFIIYFCALTLIGLMVSWHNKATSSEFMLGNRSINEFCVNVIGHQNPLRWPGFLVQPRHVLRCPLSENMESLCGNVDNMFTHLHS